MAFFGISLKNNAEQLELARLIQDNRTEIIICTGNAGTGKTFATLATALQLKLDKKYDKIVYARNPVSCGAPMGFLPGDVDDKYSPFMGGLMDNLESICRHSTLKPVLNDLKAKIETVPIAFMRGRSFESTLLIVDEAQNLDLVTLKTILTRVGNYSKVILLGSMNQIDDTVQNRKEKCDFQRVVEAIQHLDYVGHVELTQSMRSKICAELDDILSQIK